MSDKQKNITVPATKTVRSGTCTRTGNIFPSTSKTRVSPISTKEKNASPCSKLNKPTLMGHGDATPNNKEDSVPHLNSIHQHIMYGKFLRAMLEECFLDENIERKETEIYTQMTLLADRVQKTINQLDKTKNTLNDIKFVVEQERLLDLRNNDCTQFYEKMDNTNTENVLKYLSEAEQAYLDRLETRNVDFGYDKDSGHKKLLDAVNDAIEGLNNIKKDSKLELTQFKEYEKTDKCLDDHENVQLDIESLHSKFETKFSRLSEKLMKEVSEQITKVMDNTQNPDSDDD